MAKNQSRAANTSLLNSVKESNVQLSLSIQNEAKSKNIKDNSIFNSQLSSLAKFKQQNENSEKHQSVAQWQLENKI